MPAILLMPKRFWELDFFRGFAVLLMILFNYAFALRYFGIYNPALGDLFWFWFPRFVGAMFITIAGISLAVSYGRKKKNFFRRNAMRGMKIFLLGVTITLVTWIFVPQQAVLFGILHLIGLSIIIAPAFFRFHNANILLGIMIILSGIYLQGIAVDFPWLLWLGLQPHGFTTLDYFPLLPWFGFMLIGLFAGQNLYRNGRRSFEFPDLSKNPLISSLCFLGKKSLAIYLIHIPALIIVLALLGFPVLP